MDWLVKTVKKHVKHMHSKKTVGNIYDKSAAIPAVAAIGANFDETAGVRKRAKAHKRKGADQDELFMMDDLRTVKPFEAIEGRHYNDFRTIVTSQVKNIDGYKFQKWFKQNKTKITV